jgi:anti-sigma regulatory factor (Ser/Thr protein kinase)
MPFVDFNSRNIGLKGKYVFVNKLESHGELGVIVGHLNRHFHNPQTKRVSLYLKPHGPMFSNLVAPLSCILNTLQLMGKKVVIHADDPHAQEMCILDPPLASSPNMDESHRILDKVWRVVNLFHLDNIVSFMRRYLGAKLSFANPVVDSVEIALIEAIENALLHAGSDGCYVMAQIHEKQQYFSVCVSDSGIGVPRSLASGGYRYRDDTEALLASLKRGVTSKHKENRGGNGLYAISRLAKINRGHFGLWSGSNAVVVDGKAHGDRTYQFLPHLDQLRPGTHVDFQIPLVGPITTDYHEVTDDMMTINLADAPPDGFKNIEVITMPEGYHSRYAGAVAREIAGRFLADSAVQGLVIDFSQIPICSLSFLDSFLGILSKTLGKDAYEKKILVRGTTTEMRRAIASVMAWR